MISLLSSLPGIVIALAVTLGALYAFRRSNVKQLGELQEQIIGSYKTLNETQAKELSNLRHEVMAMRVAFKQLGMEIEINGTTITIINGQQAKRKRIIQIPADEDEDK